jgi:hypothetical protein
LPPDLVQRCQAQVAVDRGVLDPFGHDWTGGLLKAHDELVVAAVFEQQYAAQRRRQ